MSADESDPESSSSHPEPPEPTYPPAPEIKKVKTESRTPGSPNTIRITVEYYSHRGHADPFETTVIYRVKNGTAEVRDVEGDGKLADQLSAIITAGEAVVDVAGVEEVKRLEQVRGEAMKHIGNCEEGE